jgi:hypothetical protein
MLSVTINGNLIKEQLFPCSGNSPEIIAGSSQRRALYRRRSDKTLRPSHPALLSGFGLWRLIRTLDRSVRAFILDRRQERCASFSHVGPRTLLLQR